MGNEFQNQFSAMMSLLELATIEMEYTAADIEIRIQLGKRPQESAMLQSMLRMIRSARKSLVATENILRTANAEAKVSVGGQDWPMAEAS